MLRTACLVMLSLSVVALPTSAAERPSGGVRSWFSRSIGPDVRVPPQRRHVGVSAATTTAAPIFELVPTAATGGLKPDTRAAVHVPRGETITLINAEFGVTDDTADQAGTTAPPNAIDIGGPPQRAVVNQQPGFETPYPAIQQQPVMIYEQPRIPNPSSISGPQYFSDSTGQTSSPVPVYPGQDWRTASPVSLQHTYAAPVSQNTSFGAMPVTTNAQMNSMGGGVIPQTGASLYPTPQPNIPWQVGGTAITNQAFYPQEMLHAHEYRAVYPPYYYKVNGGWMVTPWGVWSHEDYKLMGTEVKVKYRSNYGFLSGFTPPVIR